MKQIKLNPVKTKFGEISVETLMFPRSEEDKIKIYDTDDRYLDCFTIQELLNSACEMETTLEEEYATRLKAFREEDNFEDLMHLLTTKCIMITKDDEAIIKEHHTQCWTNEKTHDYVNRIGTHYIVMQSNKEDIMLKNRLEAIANYTKHKEEKELEKQKRLLEEETMLKQTILNWSSRIQNLITTANSCLEHGIAIAHDSTRYCDYDHGHFITDSWAHRVGFEYRGDDNKITRIGKMGGGCEDYDVYTDGYVVYAQGSSKMYALRTIVSDFEEFESKFYAYVDSVCANNK